jgi:CheY-like chemotaxis protein
MPRVLLADDDDDLRSLLAANFRRAGLEVIEVRDGTELLELIAAMEDGTIDPERRPDVVVTDVYMPGANGLEALARIRHSAHPLPVVVLTAFDDSGAEAAARELGASAMFCKPVDLAVLRTKLFEIAALHLPMDGRGRQSLGPRELSARR